MRVRDYARLEGARQSRESIVLEALRVGDFKQRGNQTANMFVRQFKWANMLFCILCITHYTRTCDEIAHTHITYKLKEYCATVRRQHHK